MLITARRWRGVHQDSPLLLTKKQAYCPWVNLNEADKSLTQNHQRRIHYSDLLIISCSLVSVFTFAQSLVALVLLHSKSTPAPSSYQVFKSSNFHLNKSQSLHTCKQSTEHQMMTFIIPGGEEIETLSDCFSDKEHLKKKTQKQKEAISR